MNSIWNKNISLLKERFPSLAELYKDYLGSPQFNQNPPKIDFWKIALAKNGSPTAEDLCTSPAVRLHSSYNPEREAYNAVTQAALLEKSAVVFLGCGLGYHLTQLADYLTASSGENKHSQQTPSSKKIILIEPNAEYFFAALALLDWTSVFRIEKLVLAIGCPQENLIPLLEDSEHINIGSTGVSDSYFFDIPAFTAHAQDYFCGVRTLIQRNKTKNDINAATYKKFSKLWIRNSKNNLENITRCSTVKQFLQEEKAFAQAQKDSYYKRDCLIVAAGPSLEKILPFMKELQKYFTIICVETALRALLRLKVQPDFIILTDPQYYAYRHIAGLSAPGSILVCPLSVYPAVFRFNCREILLCSDFFPISTFFEKQLGEFGNLGAGGSVASSAWNLAYQLKAQRIFLAGLDLSFPSKQIHIKGSSAEQTFHTKANRLISAEKSSCASMYSANPEYGLSYNGKKVLTDSRMKMFAWWFESRLAACPDVKTFTLCPESLKIPGVEVADIEEVLNIGGAPAPSRQKLSVFGATPSSGEKDSASATTFSTSKQGIESLPRNAPNISEAVFIQTKNEFITQLKKLTALVNTTIEKCLIYENAGGDSQAKLQLELAEIEEQLLQNPLTEIIRLAAPAAKTAAGTSDKPSLNFYQQLKKELEKYMIQ